MICGTAACGMSTQKAIDDQAVSRAFEENVQVVYMDDEAIAFAGEAKVSTTDDICKLDIIKSMNYLYFKGAGYAKIIKQDTDII